MYRPINFNTYRRQIDTPCYDADVNAVVYGLCMVTQLPYSFAHLPYHLPAIVVKWYLRASSQSVSISSLIFFRSRYSHSHIGGRGSYAVVIAAQKFARAQLDYLYCQW